MNFDVGSLFSKKNLPTTLALGPLATMMQSGSGQSSNVPNFDPQQALGLQAMQFNQMYPQALDFGADAYNQASAQGIDFSKRGTQANIQNQNRVTPGSAAQRQLAQNQINQYIQGNVPLDVQQNINRQVAQNLGGGFNLYSGGGQAPQNFARNIGQTSLGLSQFGLSAAPTWQQLANSMVVRPEVGLSAGLSAIGTGAQLASSAAGYGNSLAESQYQSDFNQYQGNRLQNQQNQQFLMQLGQTGLQALEAYGKAKYLGGLSPSGQGRQNTLGSLPATGYGAYNQPGGALYQPGTTVMVPAFGG
jgi:hypothetical protein